MSAGLIRTSLFTSFAVGVRIITAFILNKLVSVSIGPAGVAMVGQLNNFFGIVATIGTGGINNGIVRYISENKDESVAQKVIATSFRVITFCSLLAGMVILVFSSWVSELIFKSYEYRFLVIIIACSLLFASLNTLLMGVLNGFREVKKYAYANISSSLLVLVLSVVLVIEFKLTGVLIAMVIGQSAVFIITLFFALKSRLFRLRYFFLGYDKEILKNLSKYSLMTLVSSFAGPLALLFIRNYIGNQLSWDEAGYWQGVFSISEVYLMFFTSSLAVYYLPRLAEISEPAEMKREIMSTAKIILPVAFIAAILVYIFKHQLVILLFTERFNPMLPLFKFQLIGDVIKVASFLLAYQMVAKSMVKLFIFTEVAFSLSLVLLSVYCIQWFGLEGSAIAFSLNYGLYLVFLLIYFRKQVFAL